MEKNIRKKLAGKNNCQPLPKSKYFNLCNLLFVKLYDSGNCSRKIATERYLYYEVLDRNDRNLFDKGFIIKVFGYCLWFRRWKKGSPVGSQILAEDEISIIVDKLIKIHSLKIPEALAKKLPDTKGILSWLDHQLETSLLREWQILNKANVDSLCIVHGDFQPKKHVIKFNERLEIIDFGDSFIGHPSVDLGAIACSNPELFEQVFISYNKKISKPVSREMVDFWKRYFEVSNIFWMNFKFKT